MAPATLLLAIVAAALLAALLFLVWKARYTRAVRQDAVQRSLAVTTGKVFEQLVPYLPDFPFNPKDARFLGSPVDFVVFGPLVFGWRLLRLGAVAKSAHRRAVLRHEPR